MADATGECSAGGADAAAASALASMYSAWSALVLQAAEDATSVYSAWRALVLQATEDDPMSKQSLIVAIATLLALYVVASWFQRTHGWYHLSLWIEYLVTPVPTLNVAMIPPEATNDDSSAQEGGGEDNGDNPNRIGTRFFNRSKASSSSLSSSSSSNKKTITDPNQPGWIQCYNPSTGCRLGKVKAMTAADVDECVQKAATAQMKWSRTTFAQRRLVLRTLQRYICDHVAEICQTTSLDSGKPELDAVLGEILTTTEKIRTVCEMGELWLRPSYRTTGPMMMHKTAAVEYVPMGVIGTIAPWNYPFHNMMNHIISGIFAGNAVVGKVSEHTSWSSLYFTNIVRAALKIHGHDPELCQTITGLGDAGAALVAHPKVDKIIFTGSPEIGKLVMLTAAKYLKPVILELGGKDAMIIMDDCKLSEIVPWVMRGCFQNGGQNCVGIERVLVYEGLHDAFVDAVLPKVKALRQGVPACQQSDGAGEENKKNYVDCAAAVMEEQLDKIQALVDDAVAHGAVVLTGGKRNVDQNLSKGNFYEPTVLTGVTREMRIYREEVFGPVMSIIKVPNNSDEECLEMVNDSTFGLGSSVYTGNQKRGLKLGRKIRSGMLCINDFGSNYLVQSLPFGGVGDSGFGRFAGIEGLRACCLERAILTDRIPGVKTNIPPPVDYPIDKKGFGFAESLIQLFYNESMIGKLRAIFGLIKNS